jgi:hypothetical protein
MMSEWTIERARQTYSIAHWSEGYFDVDAQGRIEVQPQGPQGTALALPEVVAAAEASGLKLPLLVRFQRHPVAQAVAHAGGVREGDARHRIRWRLHRRVPDQGQPAPRCAGELASERRR